MQLKHKTDQKTKVFFITEIIWEEIFNVDVFDGGDSSSLF